MQITKEFTFEAAHRLPQVPPEHKCAQLHGHSYRVQIDVEGTMRDKEGWVMDFARVADIWKPTYARLDHHLLNQIPGLSNPTAERLCWWLFAELYPLLPGLDRIKVWETTTSCASLAVYEFQEVTGG